QLILRILANVWDIRDGSGENGTGGCATATRRNWKRLLDRLKHPGTDRITSRILDELAVVDINGCTGAFAQLPRIRRDRLEYRLHVPLRLADHAQDLARRTLLLQ